MPSTSKQGSGVWPAILIGLGLVLLLNNFNLLSWEAWYQLWQFWPLLLILVGLQIILGRSWFSKIVMTILTLIVIASVLALILAPTVPVLDRFLKKSFPQLPQIPVPQEWEEETAYSTT